MMYKGKYGKYAAAGVQKSPSIMIDVSSSVHVPDSEAGASWYDPDQKPFYAETVTPARRMPRTVTLHSALIFLCALFVVFGALAVDRVAKKAELTKQITATQEVIQRVRKNNSELEVQVAEARDIARISFVAQTSLYMVDASSAETVAVHAPDTRPFGDDSTATVGMKTGSR